MYLHQVQLALHLDIAHLIIGDMRNVLIIGKIMPKCISKGWGTHFIYILAVF